MLTKAASLFLSIILAAGFSLAITLKQAHAYIEVGSMTFILQMLLASGFAALFMLKTFWRRVLDQISRFLATVRGTKAHSD